MSTTTTGGITKVDAVLRQPEVPINTAFDEFDGMIAGYLSISVAGGAGDTALTRAQALNKFLKLTGALTGNRTVTIPATLGFNRRYVIWNATSGAFTESIRIGAGTAVAITQGKARDLFHDGTTVYVGPEFDPATGSISGSSVENTAWTAYTPTITAGTGTFTTVTGTGAYKTIGKTVFFRLRVAITTNGTAAGYVVATLPVATANCGQFQSASGAETTTGGFTVRPALTANSSNMSLTKYDGTYPGATGYNLDITGVYESV